MRRGPARPQPDEGAAPPREPFKIQRPEVLHLEGGREETAQTDPARGTACAFLTWRGLNSLAP